MDDDNKTSSCEWWRCGDIIWYTCVLYVYYCLIIENCSAGSVRDRQKSKFTLTYCFWENQLGIN